MYFTLEQLEIIYNALDLYYDEENDPEKKKAVDLLLKKVQTKMDHMYSPKDAIGNVLPDVKL